MTPTKQPPGLPARFISANAPIRIAAGITVEPIANLFDTPEREYAFAAARQLNNGRGTPTAIVLRTQTTPICTAPLPEPDDFLMPIEPSLPPLQLALDALSIAGGAAAIPNVSYGVVEELGWPAMIAGSIGGTERSGRMVELTEDHAPALLNASNCLRGHSGDQALIRAMQKLKDAQRRTSQAERALDLGACLEILLMHEEKSDKTEIAFKIRMRAAWLLGQNPIERKSIHDLVKKAYETRSIVVHSGTLPDPKSEEDLANRTDSIYRTEQLCRDLILYVLKNGWPDWSAIVLHL